jgi:hypothetical protein
MLRLAIDFDDVIHDPRNVKPGYKMGVPILGAKEAVGRLKNDGAIIVIHSLWANTDQKRKAISEWCRYFEIPYDFITNIKPDADVYLDDKAIRFYDWEQALKDIKELT